MVGGEEGGVRAGTLGYGREQSGRGAEREQRDEKIKGEERTRGEG